MSTINEIVSIESVRALFIAHQLDIAGNAYSDGCEAFDLGQCSDEEMSVFDDTFSVFEGRLHCLDSISA